MTPTSLLDLGDRPVLTMAAAQPVSQAIAYLQATRHDYLLALDQGQVVGLLTADAALGVGC